MVGIYYLLVGIFLFVFFGNLIIMWQLFKTKALLKFIFEAFTLIMREMVIDIKEIKGEHIEEE